MSDFRKITCIIQDAFFGNQIGFVAILNTSEPLNTLKQISGTEDYLLDSLKDKLETHLSEGGTYENFNMLQWQSNEGNPDSEIYVRVLQNSITEEEFNSL